MRRLAFLALVLLQANAIASDKGIKAEMVWSSVELFCNTSIASDLKPIVEEQHQLEVSKMSQESLAQARAQMATQWKAASEKHKDAISKLALTPRLGGIDRSYIQLASQEAWAEMKRKCPAATKGPGGPDYIATFLIRRIPEL